MVVKPNIAWEQAPEFAANTNPEVVATIVEEARKAGAKKVKVFDFTVDPPKRAYQKSGIEIAAKKAGGEVIIIPNRPAFFKEMTFPKAQILKSWPIVKEALECDCLINVPIAKHHGLTRLTLGIKNLMGLMGNNRTEIHINIAQKLADLLSEIRPKLTVMDVYRVLIRHGPRGGRLEDVKLVGKIIAGADPVAVDAYTAQLPVFGLKPLDIGYIEAASRMGLGTSDLTKVKVIEEEL